VLTIADSRINIGDFAQIYFADRVANRAFYVNFAHPLERTKRYRKEITKMNFTSALVQLKARQSIQRKEWEPMTQMYVSGDQLVFQRGHGKPYPYELAWYELNKSDWQVADTGFPRSID
jgi:hypothetical protein